MTLGRDFTFSGEGLETRLAGRVRVTTTPAGTLAARGTIRAVAGTYFVFGQRLDIDRGRLIFDGPADNPALDVVALRKNLAVEAGVEVSGTVRVPRVRLVSNPPVPDGEKLSWLLTGQGLDRANRADLAALSAASASLLGQGRKPITTQIANSIGLDDISVRESASSVVGGTTGQVVAFGKRISDRLTLVYEQGLTLANNALRIEYALSRTLTLRAEAGRGGQRGPVLPAHVRLTFAVRERRRRGRATAVRGGRRSASYAFLTQAVHQPLAFTRLPANSWHGPSAAPALPE